MKNIIQIAYFIFTAENVFSLRLVICELCSIKN